MLLRKVERWIVAKLYSLGVLAAHQLEGIAGALPIDLFCFLYRPVEILAEVVIGAPDS